MAAKRHKKRKKGFHSPFSILHSPFSIIHYPMPLSYQKNGKDKKRANENTNENIRTPIIHFGIFEIYVSLCKPILSGIAFPTPGFAQFSLLTSAD